MADQASTLRATVQAQKVVEKSDNTIEITTQSQSVDEENIGPVTGNLDSFLQDVNTLSLCRQEQQQKSEPELKDPLEEDSTRYANYILDPADFDLVQMAIPADKLPKMDAFRAIRSEFPTPQTTMRLNDQQLEIVLQAGNAPGGVTIVQGPPGTGKSSMIREITKPFLLSKNVHPILIVSASEGVVDSTALAMINLIKIMQAKGLVIAGKYGLRIHSRGSGSAICNLPGMQTSSPDQTEYPARFKTEVNMKELEEITAELLKLHKDNAFPKFEGIPESQVNYPELSPGRKMLEVSGVITGPSTHSDQLRFAPFRRVYSLYAQGQPFDTNDFEEAINTLWEFTVQNASFLVATNTNGSLPQVLHNICNQVRLIMVDGAAHQQEDHLLPFFAGCFPKLDGFLQVGDHLQLLSPAMIQDSDYPSTDQAELSFMARLTAAGFPAVELNIQHRMVDDIADLANLLTYQGRLSTAPNAKTAQRSVAMAFRKMAAKVIAKKTNVIFFNVIPCPANQTQFTSSQSRYNDLFVITTINAVVDLLNIHPQATVASLTSYSAQKERLLKAKANMIQLGMTKAARWVIQTVDNALGEQWDYVTVDILVNAESRKLGFQVERHRMNVALTRAQNGLVIIADADAINRCQRSGRGVISRLINATKNHRRKTPVHKELPHCDWYSPQEILDC